jgi:hypothetical protein
MELKRKYRHVSRYELRLITLHRKIKRNKSPQPKIRELIENGWLRRNLLSLTASYHLLSNYGESGTIAAIFGGITLLLPALIWIVQGEGERQNAFERSLTDFLPFLPFRGGIEIEIGDYLV